MSNISHATSKNFDTDVLEASKEKPVLVDFYADWCGPCKRLAPLLEEVSNTRTDVQFVKVNVDDARDIATRYGIRSIPTMILFKDGVKGNTIQGSDKSAINRALLLND